MPNYRRAWQSGGTFFLTVMTHGRRPIFGDESARRGLRKAIAATGRERPFRLEAAVLLPDHVHWVMTLPPGDGDFSTRVAAIKARFTSGWLAAGGVEGRQSAGRERKAYRGVWQARFWEHWVRDENDLAGVMDYLHYNPVKHGYVRCPHAWAWSSFEQNVRKNLYAANWLCVCQAAPGKQPIPRDIPGAEMDS